ncbi:hypothetical protein DFP72DRAFT_839195 [Ephemerocybe angulata]|uniref:Uncharacterized protein n=1 Tax=Ephemerocybe angulata TaxID=980116 RepID=A0A8H6IGR0_9AGAR|nr:hypothetical protein DFP72DRAFT_839195 [Tulosesus angulatus]
MNHNSVAGVLAMHIETKRTSSLRVPVDASRLSSPAIQRTSGFMRLVHPFRGAGRRTATARNRGSAGEWVLGARSMKRQIVVEQRSVAETDVGIKLQLNRMETLDLDTPFNMEEAQTHDSGGLYLRPGFVCRTAKDDDCDEEWVMGEGRKQERLRLIEGMENPLKGDYSMFRLHPTGCKCLKAATRWDTQGDYMCALGYTRIVEPPIVAVFATWVGGGAGVSICRACRIGGPLRLRAIPVSDLSWTFVLGSARLGVLGGMLYCCADRPGVDMATCSMLLLDRGPDGAPHWAKGTILGVEGVRRRYALNSRDLLPSFAQLALSEQSRESVCDDFQAVKRCLVWVYFGGMTMAWRM